ncbi:hypothetical protein Vafri_19417 [Volvox africanus]|uniref:GYF domain-containing protein n=1 Tax=Volvox africanus TaxID=51714 RepID=A0A8J4F8N5_9CHLO|nr:hypothetical protein Vafri_19417 [Volvox africanus]
MADHIGSAFGALAGAPLPSGGADLPLSPQWRQPFGRAPSMEQPMKSALIGPWDGNNSGAQASKPDAAAKQGSTAWRGPDGPSNRDPKWPEKDRPDHNVARDRPARWREREEDSRDRSNAWDADRWGSVEEPRRWQDDRGSDRWGDAGGRGRGRQPADDRWVDRKPSGTTVGEREWLPGMPPEPELPKRPSIQDRWGLEGADRRPGEDRWRTPGGTPLAGGPGASDGSFSSAQTGRGRGFATGRGRGLKASGPTAPGSGATDRWDAPRGGHLDRQDSNFGSGGNASGYGGGGSQSGVRRYSSPVMSKIYNHMLSSHGDKLPMPRINPEVAIQYSEYLSESAAEAVAQQLGGGGSNAGAGDSGNGVSGGGTTPGGAAPIAGQTQMTSANSSLQSLPVTHELYLQDQWLYKDPQGVTQGPFTRSDILEWLAFHYFGEDLPIRAAALEGAPFVPLGQMMKMWDAIERGRPLGPPGFIPAAPVMVVSSASVDASQQPQAAQSQQSAVAPVASMSAVSSMPLSAAPSGDLSQQVTAPPAAPASAAPPAPISGSTPRTSSLLETLLGKKLASESPVQQPSAAAGGLGGLQDPLSSAAPVPIPDAVQQPGGARPFTLDLPVQLHSAPSGGLATPLGSLGGLGGPLGGSLGGFASGLPGAAGMGPGSLGGMGGPGGIGPGPWGGPLGGPGGPLPGAPGGPVLPAWGRDPLVGGFDPLRRPDLHPGIHAASGIWGSGAPFRPEGPPLGPYMPPAVGGDAAAGQPGLPPLPDALLGKVPQGQVGQPPAPGPMQQLHAPLPLQQQPQQQQQLSAQQAPQPTAWGAAPVQAVVAPRSLADIQREQAMEAARQAAIREQQQQVSLAEVAAQQLLPQPPPAQELPSAQAPQQPQPGTWAGAVGQEPYRPISGLPPALQQIFAAANKGPQASGEVASGELQIPAVEPTQQPTAVGVSAPSADIASAAAASTGGKKKKTPQLVLQEQPKPPQTSAAPPAAAGAATVTAIHTEDASAVSGQATSIAAPPRPEPKLAPWASAAAAKPPTAGMTLREIQMQEAEAAARAARVAVAAQEAAAMQTTAATAAGPIAAAAAAPSASPAGVSPWAKIAAAAPGSNPAVVSVPPPAALPAPTGSAWRPVAPPPVVAASPASVTATAAAAADTSPSRRTAPIAVNAAAAVAPAARGGRPAEPASAPVGTNGSVPRGTTLAELLEKQLNPAPQAVAAAPKAWGGVAAKPPVVTNLRAVLYEESAADLEGGAVDEDLSDVLPMLQQQQKPLQQAPLPVSANGGWAAAPPPPPGPTLRDIQQQEEEAARRRAATAAPAPARATSATAPVTVAGEDDGLFWDYGPATNSTAATARAASIEPPKPAPAPKPAAPAAPAPRGGWASTVGSAATGAPPAAPASIATKASVASAVRAPAAAVVIKGATSAPAAQRVAAPPPAPTVSTSYSPAAAAAPSGDDSTGLFDGEIQMSAEFQNWCRAKMVEFFGNDDLSLVHFLLSVNTRSEVADYCQMYMRGKPNVSTFVADFLKRKDAELARQASGAKGKNKGSSSGGGSGASGSLSVKPSAGKGATTANDWQKASAQQAVTTANKKGAGGGGKQPIVKKVGGITATVPGFSLLSDRA